MNQSKSNLADPGTLPQDTFAVLCTMDDANKIEVQKFSWVAETGPFYEVPESLADSEQHPHILKYLNSSKMKPKGRRNAKVIIRKKKLKDRSMGAYYRWRVVFKQTEPVRDKRHASCQGKRFQRISTHGRSSGAKRRQQEFIGGSDSGKIS